MRTGGATWSLPWETIGNLGGCGVGLSAGWGMEVAKRYQPRRCFER